MYTHTPSLLGFPPIQVTVPATAQKTAGLIRPPDPVSLKSRCHLTLGSLTGLGDAADSPSAQKRKTDFCSTVAADVAGASFM